MVQICEVRPKTVEVHVPVRRGIVGHHHWLPPQLACLAALHEQFRQLQIGEPVLYIINIFCDYKIFIDPWLEEVLEAMVAEIVHIQHVMYKPSFNLGVKNGTIVHYLFSLYNIRYEHAILKKSHNGKETSTLLCCWVRVISTVNDYATPLGITASQRDIIAP